MLHLLLFTSENRMKLNFTPSALFCSPTWWGDNPLRGNPFDMIVYDPRYVWDAFFLLQLRVVVKFATTNAFIFTFVLTPLFVPPVILSARERAAFSTRNFERRHTVHSMSNAKYELVVTPRKANCSIILRSSRVGRLGNRILANRRQVLADCYDENRSGSLICIWYKCDKHYTSSEQIRSTVRYE